MTCPPRSRPTGSITTGCPIHQDHQRRPSRAHRPAPGLGRLPVGAAHLDPRAAAHPADPRNQGKPAISENSGRSGGTGQLPLHYALHGDQRDRRAGGTAARAAQDGVHRLRLLRRRSRLRHYFGAHRPAWRFQASASSFFTSTAVLDRDPAAEPAAHLGDALLAVARFGAHAPWRTPRTARMVARCSFSPMRRRRSCRPACPALRSHPAVRRSALRTAVHGARLRHRAERRVRSRCTYVSLWSTDMLNAWRAPHRLERHRRADPHGDRDDSAQAPAETEAIPALRVAEFVLLFAGLVAAHGVVGPVDEKSVSTLALPSVHRRSSPVGDRPFRRRRAVPARISARHSSPCWAPCRDGDRRPATR